MDTNKSSTDGYILRIGNPDLADQVFRLGKYYSGAIRDFKRGTPILLAAKAEKGDSIIGYAIVDKVEHLWEMTPEEENYSRENGWKLALTLRETTRFADPLPISNSVLGGDQRRGAFLHGAKLTTAQIDALLEEAQKRQVA